MALPPGDLAALEVLDHDTLTTALAKRYAHGSIYTYVGDILIACNPFRSMAIYRAREHAAYASDTTRSQPPHVFAIADRAYHNMTLRSEPQVCIISGESGAGKTETAKRLLQHLVFLAQQTHGSSTPEVVDSGRDTASSFASSTMPVQDDSSKCTSGTVSIHRQNSTEAPTKADVHTRILQTTPILEAFGNATTTINANSSRFGKYLDLQFSSDGRLIGAHLRHYLLEKSRVVLQPQGESNYHAFSYMLAGLDTKLRAQLHIDAALSANRYVSPPETDAVDGLASAWASLTQAMRDVGFSSHDIEHVASLLAIVCLLGALELEEDGDESTDTVCLCDDTQLEHLAEIVGVDAKDLLHALTTSTTVVREETYVKNLTIDKCLDTIDATAKAIYERCFAWLIHRMELMLQPDELADARCTVGILDIFGFENMACNGFEQLCINLANERLQLYFNQNIFDMELRDYEQEGVDAVNVEFVSNIGTLDLLLRRPIGLLALLDEESRFSSSTDESLVAKLQSQLGKHNDFVGNGASNTFGVRHYAGLVQYTATGFLERNRDPMPDAVVQLLGAADNHLVADLFGNAVLSERPLPSFLAGERRPRASKSSGRVSIVNRRTSDIVASWHTGAAERPSNPLALFPIGEEASASTLARHASGGDAAPSNSAPHATAATVSGQFRHSLHSMVLRMERCDPHFVRCLRPNAQQEPSAFEPDIVLHQLRHTGVLETTRIRKQGFSHRVPLPKFVERYRGLAFPYASAPPPTAETCRQILEKVAQTLGAGTTVSGHAPALEGWQIGHSKVFLKYWHPDALNLVAARHDHSARALQAITRGFYARVDVRKRRACCRATKAEATTFMSELHTRAHRVYVAQEQLADEDYKRMAVAAAQRVRPAAEVPLSTAAAPATKRASVPKVVIDVDEPGVVGTGASDAPAALGQEENIYLAPASPAMQRRRSSSRLGRILPHKVSVRKQTTMHMKSMRKHEKSVVAWWTRQERAKGKHCDASGAVFPWFHGLLDRAQADEFLEEMPDGYFLVRVCQAFHGYALTYRDQGRSKHHRVALKPQTGRYQAQGKTEDFDSLEELIDYYAMVPLEPEGATLLGHVRCAHAYNLGTLDADVESNDGVDPASRGGDGGTGKNSKRRKNKGRLHERRGRSGSIVSLVVLPEDEEGEPMKPDMYLEEGARPTWLMGQLSRDAAEQELGRHAGGNGTFLVREKIVAANRVVFALSFKLDGNFRHHLLERAREGVWKLDGDKTELAGPLNNVIRTFQRAKWASLPCCLAEDAPPPPPRSPQPVRQALASKPLPAAPTAAPAIKLMGRVEHWTVDAVVQWLNSHSLHRYAGAFRRRVVDGNMLLSLHRQQLRELVDDAGHRHQLYKALSALKTVNTAMESTAAAGSTTPSPKALAPTTPPSALSRGLHAHHQPQHSHVFHFPETSTDMHPDDSLTPRTAPHIFYSRKRRWFRRCPEERLRLACLRGDLAAAKALVRKYPKKHVDRVYRHGDRKTPLFLAAEAGHADLVRLLLEEGGNPFKSTTAGMTPVDAASVNNHHAVVAILQGTEAELSRSSFSSMGSFEGAAGRRNSPARSARVASRLVSPSTGAASPPVPPRSSPGSPRAARRGLQSPRSTRKVGAMLAPEQLVQTRSARVADEGSYEMPHSPLSQCGLDAVDSGSPVSRRSRLSARSQTDSPVGHHRPMQRTLLREAPVPLQTTFPAEGIYFGESPRATPTDEEAAAEAFLAAAGGRAPAADAWSANAPSLSVSQRSTASAQSNGSAVRSSPSPQAELAAMRQSSSGSPAPPPRIKSFPNEAHVSPPPSPAREERKEAAKATSAGPPPNRDSFMAPSIDGEPVYVGVF